MYKLTPKNITLECVKQSKYWDLIAILVWNHYSEAKYQDESLISFEERWYGVSNNNNALSFSSSWSNPEHKELGYTRKLLSIGIILNRSDYKAYITIFSDGNIIINGVYHDKAIKKYPHFFILPLDVCNWMIENDFLTQSDGGTVDASKNS